MPPPHPSPASGGGSAPNSRRLHRSERRASAVAITEHGGRDHFALRPIGDDAIRAPAAGAHASGSSPRRAARVARAGAARGAGRERVQAERPAARSRLHARACDRDLFGPAVLEPGRGDAAIRRRFHRGRAGARRRAGLAGRAHRPARARAGARAGDPADGDAAVPAGDQLDHPAEPAHRRDQLPADGRVRPRRAAVQHLFARRHDLGRRARAGAVGVPDPGAGRAQSRPEPGGERAGVRREHRPPCLSHHPAAAAAGAGGHRDLPHDRELRGVRRARHDRHAVAHLRAVEPDLQPGGGQPARHSRIRQGQRHGADVHRGPARAHAGLSPADAACGPFRDRDRARLSAASVRARTAALASPSPQSASISCARCWRRS